MFTLLHETASFLTQGGSGGLTWKLFDLTTPESGCQRLPCQVKAGLVAHGHLQLLSKALNPRNYHLCHPGLLINGLISDAQQLQDQLVAFAQAYPASATIPHDLLVQLLCQDRANGASHSVQAGKGETPSNKQQPSQPAVHGFLHDHYCGGDKLVSLQVQEGLSLMVNTEGQIGEIITVTLLKAGPDKLAVSKQTSHQQQAHIAAQLSLNKEVLQITAKVESCPLISTASTYERSRSFSAINNLSPSDFNPTATGMMSPSSPTPWVVWIAARCLNSVHVLRVVSPLYTVDDSRCTRPQTSTESSDWSAVELELMASIQIPPPEWDAHHQQLHSNEDHRMPLSFLHTSTTTPVVTHVSWSPVLPEIAITLGDGSVYVASTSACHNNCYGSSVAGASAFVNKKQRSERPQSSNGRPLAVLPLLQVLSPLRQRRSPGVSSGDGRRDSSTTNAARLYSSVSTTPGVPGATHPDMMGEQPWWSGIPKGNTAAHSTRNLHNSHNNATTMCGDEGSFSSGLAPACSFKTVYGPHPRTLICAQGSTLLRVHVLPASEVNSDEEKVSRTTSSPHSESALFSPGRHPRERHNNTPYNNPTASSMPPDTTAPPRVTPDDYYPFPDGSPAVRPLCTSPSRSSTSHCSIRCDELLVLPKGETFTALSFSDSAVHHQHLAQQHQLKNPVDFNTNSSFINAGGGAQDSQPNGNKCGAHSPHQQPGKGASVWQAADYNDELPGNAMQAQPFEQPTVDTSRRIMAPDCTASDITSLMLLCVVTDRRVMLLDLRRPGLPLLHWAHSCHKAPPTLLSLVFPLPTTTTTSSDPDFGRQVNQPNQPITKLGTVSKRRRHSTEKGMDGQQVAENSLHKASAGISRLIPQSKEEMLPDAFNSNIHDPGSASIQLPWAQRSPDVRSLKRRQATSLHTDAADAALGECSQELCHDGNQRGVVPSCTLNPGLHTLGHDDALAVSNTGWIQGFVMYANSGPGEVICLRFQLRPDGYEFEIKDCADSAEEGPLAGGGLARDELPDGTASFPRRKMVVREANSHISMMSHDSGLVPPAADKDAGLVKPGTTEVNVEVSGGAPSGNAAGTDCLQVAADQRTSGHEPEHDWQLRGVSTTARGLPSSSVVNSPLLSVDDIIPASDHHVISSLSKFLAAALGEVAKEAVELADSAHSGSLHHVWRPRCFSACQAIGLPQKVCPPLRQSLSKALSSQLEMERCDLYPLPKGAHRFFGHKVNPSRLRAILAEEYRESRSGAPDLQGLSILPILNNKGSLGGDGCSTPFLLLRLNHEGDVLVQSCSVVSASTTTKPLPGSVNHLLDSSLSTQKSGVGSIPDVHSANPLDSLSPVQPHCKSSLRVKRTMNPALQEARTYVHRPGELLVAGQRFISRAHAEAVLSEQQRVTLCNPSGTKLAGSASTCGLLTVPGSNRESSLQLPFHLMHFTSMLAAFYPTFHAPSTIMRQDQKRAMRDGISHHQLDSAISDSNQPSVDGHQPLRLVTTVLSATPEKPLEVANKDAWPGGEAPVIASARNALSGREAPPPQNEISLDHDVVILGQDEQQREEEKVPNHYLPVHDWGVPSELSSNFWDIGDLKGDLSNKGLSRSRLESHVKIKPLSSPGSWASISVPPQRSQASVNPGRSPLCLLQLQSGMVKSVQSLVDGSISRQNDRKLWPPPSSFHSLFPPSSESNNSSSFLLRQAIGPLLSQVECAVTVLEVHQRICVEAAQVAMTHNVASSLQPFNNYCVTTESNITLPLARASTTAFNGWSTGKNDVPSSQQGVKLSLQGGQGDANAVPPAAAIEAVKARCSDARDESSGRIMAPGHTGGSGVSVVKTGDLQLPTCLNDPTTLQPQTGLMKRGRPIMKVTQPSPSRGTRPPHTRISAKAHSRHRAWTASEDAVIIRVLQGQARSSPSSSMASNKRQHWVEASQRLGGVRTKDDCYQRASWALKAKRVRRYKDGTVILLDRYFHSIGFKEYSADEMSELSTSCPNSLEEDLALVEAGMLVSLNGDIRTPEAGIIAKQEPGPPMPRRPWTALEDAVLIRVLQKARSSREPAVGPAYSDVLAEASRLLGGSRSTVACDNRVRSGLKAKALRRYSKDGQVVLLDRYYFSVGLRHYEPIDLIDLQASCPRSLEEDLRLLEAQAVALPTGGAPELGIMKGQQGIGNDKPSNNYTDSNRYKSVDELLEAVAAALTTTHQDTDDGQSSMLMAQPVSRSGAAHQLLHLSLDKGPQAGQDLMKAPAVLMPCMGESLGVDGSPVTRDPQGRAHAITRAYGLPTGVISSLGGTVLKKRSSSKDAAWTEPQSGGNMNGRVMNERRVRRARVMKCEGVSQPGDQQLECKVLCAAYDPSLPPATLRDFDNNGDLLEQGLAGTLRRAVLRLATMEPGRVPTCAKMSASCAAALHQRNIAIKTSEDAKQRIAPRPTGMSRLNLPRRLQSLQEKAKRADPYLGLPLALVPSLKRPWQLPGLSTWQKEQCELVAVAAAMQHQVAVQAALLKGRVDRRRVYHALAVHKDDGQLGQEDSILDAIQPRADPAYPAANPESSGGDSFSRGLHSDEAVAGTAHYYQQKGTHGMKARYRYHYTGSNVSGPHGTSETMCVTSCQLPLNQNHGTSLQRHLRRRRRSGKQKDRGAEVLKTRHALSASALQLPSLAAQIISHDEGGALSASALRLPSLAAQIISHDEGGARGQSARMGLEALLRQDDHSLLDEVVAEGPSAIDIADNSTSDDEIADDDIRKADDCPALKPVVTVVVGRKRLVDNLSYKEPSREAHLDVVRVLSSLIMYRSDHLLPSSTSVISSQVQGNSDTSNDVQDVGGNKAPLSSPSSFPVVDQAQAGYAGGIFLVAPSTILPTSEEITSDSTSLIASLMRSWPEPDRCRNHHTTTARSSTMTAAHDAAAVEPQDLPAADAAAARLNAARKPRKPQSKSHISFFMPKPPPSLPHASSSGTPPETAGLHQGPASISLTMERSKQILIRAQKQAREKTHTSKHPHVPGLLASGGSRRNQELPGWLLQVDLFLIRLHQRLGGGELSPTTLAKYAVKWLNQESFHLDGGSRFTAVAAEMMTVRGILKRWRACQEGPHCTDQECPSLLHAYLTNLTTNQNNNVSTSTAAAAPSAEYANNVIQSQDYPHSAAAPPSTSCTLLEGAAGAGVLARQVLDKQRVGGQVESMCRQVEDVSPEHWRWLLRQHDERVLRGGPLSVFNIRTSSHHRDLELCCVVAHQLLAALKQSERKSSWNALLPDGGGTFKQKAPEVVEVVSSQQLSPVGSPNPQDHSSSQHHSPTPADAGVQLSNSTLSLLPASDSSSPLAFDPAGSSAIRLYAVKRGTLEGSATTTAVADGVTTMTSGGSKRRWNSKYPLDLSIWRPSGTTLRCIWASALKRMEVCRYPKGSCKELSSSSRFENRPTVQQLSLLDQYQCKLGLRSYTHDQAQALKFLGMRPLSQVLVDAEEVASPDVKTLLRELREAARLLGMRKSQSSIKVSAVKESGNSFLSLEVMASHMAFGLDWRRSAEMMYDDGAAWVRLIGVDAAAKVLSKAWHATTSSWQGQASVQREDADHREELSLQGDETLSGATGHYGGMKVVSLNSYGRHWLVLLERYRELVEPTKVSSGKLITLSATPAALATTAPYHLLLGAEHHDKKTLVHDSAASVAQCNTEVTEDQDLKHQLSAIKWALIKAVTDHEQSPPHLLSLIFRGGMK
ncbi:hypothetical protein CEUSTIGMA_g6370.t1 [Chlamydomonas eustigma]|uniref:Myb-like domain-containing protein n=1 Tax=Chlamydomonas eustigma TaxID=1157962 RepID=A0A250X772_9CHLO|nr:hypothetical protein CEUSTIGMA_g6370.t1 [Chlamydomonas eustigma]|eukprot:GAX78931.1 hypothetical protein CEUSTIGMA_g6370.t1 [Chlamydomonas eustigma]